MKKEFKCNSCDNISIIKKDEKNKCKFCGIDKLEELVSEKLKIIKKNKKGK